MGVDIHGWVEISEWGRDKWDEEYAWGGVINVGSIVQACDEVSELLFGFSKGALIGRELPHVPIAMNRGTPANPSSQVSLELEWIQEHERKFGPGEFRGYSHLYMSEIDALDWQHYGVATTEPNDWWLLFKMIDALRSDQRFVNAGFRLVCWVSW